MKYIVLTAKSTFDLEQVVDAHIKLGWIPTGSVAVQGQYYYQAMTKGAVCSE